jgi:predicted nucleic acid-binding protein
MKTTCPKCKRRIVLKKSRKIKCKCGHEFSYSTYFGKDRVFLIDANIFIYSLNNDSYRGRSCKNVLSRCCNIATTEQVLNEVKNRKYNTDTIPTYTVNEICFEVRERIANSLKQPSEKDLSLIQAAIEHPEIGGIITYDQDFKSIATSGLIKSKSSKDASEFFVGDAVEFLKKYGLKT